MTEPRDRHPIYIQPLTDADREWVAQFIRVRWGASSVVAHGNVYYPHTLPGFLALRHASSDDPQQQANDDDRVGLLAYWVVDDEMEIVTLVAVHRNALERSRALKPEIPLVGQHGIPLRDEIELEYRLPPA